MKKNYILLASFFYITICFGQTLRFNKINSKDGLSQSEVYSFLKDRNGFMWIGTMDGLNRYDGYTIKKYNTNKNDINSLSNNTICALAEDSLGRIWIGTNDGLNVLYPFNQKIYQVKIKKTSVPFNKIHNLLVDGDLLWISTTEGLLKVEINNNKLEIIESSLQRMKKIGNMSLGNLRVNTIFKTSKGDYYLGLDQKIIVATYNRNNKQFSLKNKDDFFSRNGATHFAEDKNGNIWIANVNISMGAGLFRYNSNTNELSIFTSNYNSTSLSSNHVSSLAVDKTGNVWIGTIDGGLNKVNSKDVSHKDIVFEKIKNNIYEPNSLSSNLIFSLYTANDNSLWVGTIGSGINILNLNQKQFYHYITPVLNNDITASSNFIRAVYLDPFDKLWIGKHNNGLFSFDRQTGIYKKVGFDTQSVFHIGQFDSNSLVICALGANIVNYNGAIRKIEGIDRACFFSTHSSKNTLWIGGILGVYRVEFDGYKASSVLNYNTISSKPKLSYSNCRVLQYDKYKNELWIGTEGGGLNIFTLDKNQFPSKCKVYRKSSNTNSISNNYIRALYQQDKNTFWIGTYEGLNKVIRNEQSGNLYFTHYFMEDGLANNMIQSIQEDNDHMLWIGTNSGLTKFNPKTGKMNSYSSSDGLQSNEFSEHTCFKSQKGELFFGGINGITSFFPNKIKNSFQKANTSITDFYISNERVNPNMEINGRMLLEKPIFLVDQIKLKPRENNIRFDFSAMNFNSPEKIKYAYILDGYDNKWSQTDASNRSAIYTNLPHGDYTFMVKSTNEDQVWGKSIRKIEIHIATPFYLSWLAILIYIASILFFIYYFTRYSIIKIATKQQIINDGEHNQRLHELDMIRTRFFINISHDLRTPLTLIAGPVNQIIKNANYPLELKEQLGVVLRNANKLKYLIEQLLDYRKVEVGNLKASLRTVEMNHFVKEEADHFDFLIKDKGLELIYDFKLDELKVQIDTEKTAKIIFNLLSNAVKYTHKGSISIIVDKIVQEGNSAKEYTKVSVKDTGVGIEKGKENKIFDRFYYDSKSVDDSSYGIGLSHCKDLIGVMSGFLTVESELGSGSTFSFFIPIENQVQDVDIPTISTSESKTKMQVEFIPSLSENSSEPQHKANTLLIVEDNKEMREYIKSCLTNDYNILEAENGAQGYEVAVNEMPDLIISDFSMPIMDGIEFCEKVKITIETSHIPVILLTARTDNEIKYKGLEKGADDYISKPFEIEYLSLKIRNLIKDRENLRKLFQSSLGLSPSKVTVTSLDEKFMTVLVEKIEIGIPDSEFSVECLEKDMAMSHSKFYRKIKSLTGLSGKELLQDFRLKRAAQILSDNDISIADVCYMVGFTDPKYFSACFKEKFKLNPSEYRLKK